MRIDVFTLFPEWFDWMRRPRHLANAALVGGLELRCFSTRATPRRCAHGQVDDAPYGGGPGMVIRVDVVAAALEAVYGEPAERCARRAAWSSSPRAGRPFTDAVARELGGASPSSTCSAAATRASTSACTSTLADDAISPRARSCWPAARSPRWR